MAVKSRESKTITRTEHLRRQSSCFLRGRKTLSKSKVHLSMNSITAEILSVMALSSFSSFEWLRDACFLSHQSETFIYSVYKVTAMNNRNYPLEELMYIENITYRLSKTLTLQTDLLEKSRKWKNDKFSELIYGVYIK